MGRFHGGNQSRLHPPDHKPALGPRKCGKSAARCWITSTHASRSAATWRAQASHSPSTATSPTCDPARPGPRTNWQQTAAKLGEAITCGSLVPGDDLPSVSELARIQGLKPGTIQHAFFELAEEGLLLTESSGRTRTTSRLPSTRRESISASETSLLRKRSIAQDFGQARPSTAEKYRNRDGGQRISADFDGRTTSLRAGVFKRRFDVPSRWHAEGHGSNPLSCTSSASCTAASKPALATRKQSPGRITKSIQPLDRLSPG